MIKVSIIVPCYNVENYVRRCLHSLVNQTLQEIEIILINDASTDNTIDILKEYSNMYKDKIHIIDLKENARQGNARNVGLSMAKGKYISFVDSDDWVDLTMCEKLYKIASENDYDVVRFYLIKAKEVCGNYKIGTNIKGLIINEYDSKMYELYGLSMGVTRVVNYFYNREFLLSTGIKFPKGLYFEDGYFSLVLNFYIKSRGFSDEILYYYFTNSSSTVNNSNHPSYFDRIKIMKISLNELKMKQLYEDNIDDIEHFFIDYYFTSIQYFFNRFDEIPFESISEMSNWILSNFPDYQSKAFRYIEDEGMILKFKILNICDENPRNLLKAISENSDIQKKIRIF